MDQRTKDQKCPSIYDQQSKTIKISNYSHSEGKRPMKRQKGLEQRVRKHTRINLLDK